jgi:hypothetical protein
MAGTLQYIQLVDGSELRAEVISFSADTYTLRSTSLGEVKIPAGKIRTISTQPKAAAANSVAPTATSGGSAMDNVRRSLMEDKNAMTKIESLQDDPVVKDILNDEATMRAINSGDLSALMNNPKIKALMENPAIKEITQSSQF